MQFNIDFDKVEAQTGDYPAVVAGRVAHIDADFACYIVTAETRDELDGLKPRKTWEKMVEKIHDLLEHQMRLCGAETYVAHITPGGTDKGDRHEHAVLKPYQGNRADSEKPEFLDRMRAYVGEELNSVVSLDQEADDALTQANVAAIARGERNLSVVVSKDKDLRMAPGLHWDFENEKVIDVDGFGYVYKIDGGTSASGKRKPAKYMGWGTAFFWLQTLMGDTADNISGLPLAHGDTLADLGIGKPKQKPRKCGPALAFQIINGLETDEQALDVVMALWETCPEDLVHHRTQEPVHPWAAMIGDMRTLWMRRHKGADDIDNFIKEVRDLSSARRAAS